MKHAVVAALLSALPVFAIAEGIHQWRDDAGNIHFGDRPPAGAASQTVAVKPNVYTTPSIEGLSDTFGTAGEVVLYSASWCGYCKKAREYFLKQGIAFKEYDIETSARGKRDYARLKARGVPVILVGKQRMNGFSAPSFEALYARVTE